MISNKRSQLENFLQEQIIGPGALGNKLVYIGEDSEIRNFDIVYGSPASIYSSGIVFPLKESKSDDEKTITIESQSSNENDEEAEEQNIELVEENPTPMFNNAIGLSFVISELEELKNIHIEISGRNYSKLSPEKAKKNIGVRLDWDLNTFKLLLDEYNSLQNKIIVNSEYISLNESFVFTSDSKLFKDELKLKKSALCEKIKNDLSLGEELRLNYIGALEPFLYREIKKQKNDLYLKAIAEIEEINQFESYIRDLLDLNRGVWKGKEIKKRLKLNDIDFSITNFRSNYTYDKYSKLLDGVISESDLKLSCNLTVSRNRREQSDENIYVKIQLVNRGKVKETQNSWYSVVNDDVNNKSFFGAKIKVESNELKLLPYNTLNLKSKKEYSEDETSKYIYRKFNDYGIGHNCSVNWVMENDKILVETSFLPSNETPDVDTVPKNSELKILDKSKNIFKPKNYIENEECIQIKSLSLFSNKSDDDVIQLLNTFIDYYQGWINNKKKQVHEIPELAKQELDKCEGDYLRIKKNIEYLDQNRDYALKAFRLMNSAMFMQMWHSQKVKSGEVEGFLEKDFSGFIESFYKEQSDFLFDEKSSAGWRAFQLAFVLLNIDGIINVSNDPEWNEKNKLVDLVWFPTGGGKTEAYLGIIAFTIIYRRLKFRKKGGGVAVIMRYTLRLLTLQQFQRATILIISLELIRRWETYNLGKEPITIGMWVGKNSLPNSRSDLEQEFISIDEQIDNNSEKTNYEINTKIPFTSCPCCGSFLFDKKEVYKTEPLKENYLNNSERLVCRNKKCSFSLPPKARRRKDQFALPILLSDEDIYENPPTLLFGTVDKFALLAHKTSDKQRHQDSRRIFGNKNCKWEYYREGGYLPPELIIQDELHLLSGPLGTAVALFENAIDQLCHQEINGKIIRPKIISSTATTRNTELQIQKLYNREVNLFPKPGTDCDDSFFAYYKRFYKTEESEPTYISKRKYLGFLPTGRTQMWMQMRLLALCYIHRAVFEDQNLDKSIFESKRENYPEKAIDFYHTVISYFNSKKEVGKTSSQIDTYLIKEIRKVFKLVLRHGKSLFNFYCTSLNQLELTGRLSGTEVKRNLSIVETHFKDEDRLKGKTPPDLVIATNMISVGIDVSRFSVILMNSMPRNIAEYIQASSRVARNQEGLVLALHHPFRSRDLSHFEKFRDFHEKFYSYVEPISITPFAEKAIRRYLNLYVATLIRQLFNFHERESANNITEEGINEIKLKILDFFQRKRQALGTASALSEKTILIISKIIDESLDYWVEKSNESDTLVFDNPSSLSKENQKGLYVPLKEYETNIEYDFWKIPMSLRSVEAETVLRILNK